MQAGEGEEGLRLDVAVSRLAPSLSRARVQRLVAAGLVRVDGRAPKSASRLRGGERIEVEIPPPEPSAVVAQDLPLEVLHEDRDLLVLDKRAGMVVHPARGTPHSTVVNALLHRLGGDAASGGRLGLVHRLDKETSGCLVVARSDEALAALQAQFQGRTVEKVYLALVHGRLVDEGRLETQYGRHPRDRKRFTSRAGSRKALTEWRAVERFGDRATLAEVRIHTGRTHQIRVHMADSGHPVLADASYGGTRREARLPPNDPVRRAAEAVGRQALHAWRLAFHHPRTKRLRRFEAPLPEDLRTALEILRKG
ncbi:MAG: RluA family pseudouridine synthase [Deltaproteobacteria bacterium]|nr:RluA family pseudouridine synthase [Deltaproteobacteria bacterium]